MRFVVSAVLCSALMTAATAFADEWKEVRGDHFIVYYGQDETFAKRVLENAERYYRRIADDLGYARASNFWQWENRAKIYIYPDQASFRKATGEPDWSRGQAAYGKKIISSYPSSSDFVEGLLPHEIAHLVFRDFVGFKGQVPLWMDEGVAQWEELEKRALARNIAGYLVTTGKARQVGELMTMNLDGLKEEEVHYFYMQAVSLVDFLIQTFGASSFTEFCRQLRDGKGLEPALRGAYGNSLGSLEEMDQRWRRYALEKAPEPLGVYTHGGKT